MFKHQTLTPQFPMQTKVKFIQTNSKLDGMTGTVKGVSSVGIAISYNVLLAFPIFNPEIEEYVEIVSIVGSCLEPIKG
jgi:hypothetical protein